MVVSFRLSRRGRRVYPPPPALTRVADDPRPHAAAPLDGPPPPPRPPSEAAGGIAPRTELPDRNVTVPVDADLEPSFALNLFPDGYSVGEPGKGMLLYLIGDDPEKRPYSRASEALFSDIEYGCLPQDILQGIPCKFRNGSMVCEVRDYRSFFSSGDDYSGDDFPKVNRIHLRLGTECVVKDLSSIADASWTYHDHLIAESIILNALQPRLNLNPTPCLETLCNSHVKKIDLDLNKQRRLSKETSLLNMSITPPENCKPQEFRVCEGEAVCIQNADLGCMPSEMLNSLSMNCPSIIHVNNDKSVMESNTDNAVQYPFTLTDSCAVCDRKQNVSDGVPDHLLQSKEQWEQVGILQVDHKTGQQQRMMILPDKINRSLNLLHERSQSKIGSPPNKTAMLSCQNSGGLQQSTSSSNEEGLDLGSHKRLQVEAMVGQTVGSKDMKVQKQVTLSMPQRDPCSSLNTRSPGTGKIPQKVKSFHISLENCLEAPIVDSNNSGTTDLIDSRTPFVVSFSASSRKAACEHLDSTAATKSQPTALKRKASEISTISWNKEIGLKGKRQQKVDTQISPPCENRSSELPAVTDSVRCQLGIGLELDMVDISLLHMSADVSESCKPNKFNVCKGAAVCIEQTALEGMPNATFNSSSVNYPSSICINNAQSIVESDHGTIVRPFSLTNSSALCDRKKSGLGIAAPDHLLQSNEERAEIKRSQVDHENGQSQWEVSVQWKRNKSLKLLNEMQESKNSISSNKTARLSSQHSKTGISTESSENEALDLGSPQGIQLKVKVGQIMDNKDMKVQKQVPLPVLPCSHPCTSFNTSNPCYDKIPEKVKSLHIRLKECHEAPLVYPNNSDMADLKDRKRPSVTWFGACSRKAACEPSEDKAATEPQPASNRKVSGIPTMSLNRQIEFNGKRQQGVDPLIKQPYVNRSSEEHSFIGGVSSPLGISSHLGSCSGHPIANSEPDIEKVLSEVILTTHRHRLNKKAAEIDVLETSCLLPPYELFHYENTEEIPYTREEIMAFHGACDDSSTCEATSTWKIRRLTFHPSHYLSCTGLADESHYTLCLIEPEAMDNHQITVGTIYGDEHIHIATLPTSCHAEKFVDQFISLMKRDGYNLCNDEVCHEPSETRQQSEEVSHVGYPAGDDEEYLQMLSPAVISLPISNNNEIGYTFHNKLPHWVLPEQSPTLESPDMFVSKRSHPGGLQYNSRIPQGSSLHCNEFAMHLHQLSSVQPSQEFSMDQYLHSRDDVLGFSDTYGASTSTSKYSQWRQEVPMDQYLQYRLDVLGCRDTYSASTSASRYSQWNQEVPMDQYLQYRHGVPQFSHGASMSSSSYGQWRQVHTPMGSVVYQWDLPAFGRQIHNSPPLHDGWSVPPSELQTIGSPQMGSWSVDSDGGSVTSAPVQLSMPLGYQYLSHGRC